MLCGNGPIKVYIPKYISISNGDSLQSSIDNNDGREMGAN